MQFLEKLWEMEKTSRYKTCHNRKKKKLFGVRTKFQYYKDFNRKFVSYRNEKTHIYMYKPFCLGLSIDGGSEYKKA